MKKRMHKKKIKEINNEKNAIMIAENLVKTKGFKDIIIFKNNGNDDSNYKSRQTRGKRNITNTKYYNKRVECEHK